MLPASEQALATYPCRWCSGLSNAQSVPELAGRMKCNERTINSQIRNLRLSGLPVCGTPNEGHFIPLRREDAEHTLASLQSRIDAIGEAKAAMVEGLDQMFGDSQLFSIQEVM